MAQWADLLSYGTIKAEPHGVGTHAYILDCALDFQLLFCLFVVSNELVVHPDEW